MFDLFELFNIKNFYSTLEKLLVVCIQGPALFNKSGVKSRGFNLKKKNEVDL